MRKSLIFLLLICFVFIISGCGLNNSETKKSVSVGLLRLTSSAPVFVGLEKGFFKEEGLTIDVKWFDAAQPIAVAVGSNNIDVGATGITAGLYNLIGQGQKIAIVADKGHEQPGILSTALMVSTKNMHTGIRSVEQLKGKKIGITQRGSTFEYMIGRLLEQHQLTLQDVELIPLGKVSSILAALESEQIDAAIVNQPHIALAEQKGFAHVVQSVGDVMTYQTSGIFYSPQFTKNEDVALAFMRAYIKSVSYYYDAVLKPEKGENYSEVIKIIAQYTNTPEELVRQGLPYINPNAELLTEDIQTQLDWYNREGFLVTPLTTNDVVETKFWQKALP